jgi:myo-inositol-1(or 4)-monophosphatase
VSTKSTPTDLVSESDLAAEALIRSRLAESRPDDGIVGEEGDDLAGASDRRWVVDPLDGTINFLFGIPQWGVSIAVEDAAGGLAAVVYDPMRDEVWSAVRGGAPLLDGTPVAPSLREDLATSLVATGFGYDAAVRAQQGELVARLLPHVRDIRRLGSAALDLCWTACGRYDAYFERGVQHWDVAAGALLCECAGLVVRRLEPAPPAEAGVLVAAPGLIDALAPYVA